MDNRRILLIITILIAAAVTGFLLTEKTPGPQVAEPGAASPAGPLIINQPSGDFTCEDLYDEIEKDIDNANYCQVDSDCGVLILGVRYVDFGCYHFINKKVDQGQFYKKMDVYKQKCSQIINKCAPAPEAKCVSNKCAYAE